MVPNCVYWFVTGIQIGGRPVARPREFDIDEALEKAIEAFWARGYEATSVADLMTAMSLQKGSLYKAFGDKRSLFDQAFGRYLDEAYAAQRKALSGDAPPLESLRRWIGAAIESVRDGESCRRGCFAVNTLVELGPEGRDVGDRLERHFQRLARLVAETVTRGQAAGEIRRDAPPDALAQLLLVFLCGLLANLRGPMAESEATRIAELALRLLA